MENKIIDLSFNNSTINVSTLPIKADEVTRLSFKYLRILLTKDNKNKEVIEALENMENDDNLEFYYQYYKDLNTNKWYKRIGVKKDRRVIFYITFTAARAILTKVRNDYNNTTVETYYGITSERGQSIKLEVETLNYKISRVLNTQYIN